MSLLSKEEEALVERLLNESIAAEKLGVEKPPIGDLEQRLLKKYRVLINSRATSIQMREEVLNGHIAHLDAQKNMWEPENHYDRMVDGVQRPWPILVNTPNPGRNAILKVHQILEQINSPHSERLFRKEDKDFVAPTQAQCEEKNCLKQLCRRKNLIFGL